MLGYLLLLAVVILPSARPERADFAGFTGLGEYLDNWKAVLRDWKNIYLPTRARQEEQGVALREVAAAGVEVRAQLEQLQVDFTELIKLIQVTQANMTQILIDLQILKGRQAVSGAVQGGQVFMFAAYLLTITVLYLVKHCKKQQRRIRDEEIELMDQKNEERRSRRRAAAKAKGGSAQQQ